MKQVFLSYARVDKADARRLYDHLARSGLVRIWFDAVDLLPGMRWRPAIRKAIRESRYFVALMSKKSVSARGFRHSELRQAIEVMEEFPDDAIYLLPARLDDCDPPIDSLREITYADLFPCWEEGVDRLWKSLGLKRRADADLRASHSRAKRPAPRTSSTPRTPARTPKSRMSRKTIKPRIYRAPRVRASSRVDPADYHYRMGLVDVDGRVSQLRAIARGLNAVQRTFHFTRSATNSSRRALRSIDGRPHLDIDGLSAAFYRKASPLRMDHVVCVTHRLLTFSDDEYVFSNYLGAPSASDERVIFMSVYDLEDHAAQAGVSLEVAIAYLLVSELAWYFLDVGYHKTIRGCPLDFTEDHSKMAKGLAAGKFCASCNRKLDKNKALKRRRLRCFAGVVAEGKFPCYRSS